MSISSCRLVYLALTLLKRCILAGILLRELFLPSPLPFSNYYHSILLFYILYSVDAVPMIFFFHSESLYVLS